MEKTDTNMNCHETKSGYLCNFVDFHVFKFLTYMHKLPQSNYNIRRFKILDRIVYTTRTTHFVDFQTRPLRNLYCILRELRNSKWCKIYKITITKWNM